MLMRLSGGDSVLIHLGMSGRMVARAALRRMRRRRAADRRTSTWRWRPTEGVRVGFVDPRRFGCVDLVPTAEEDGHRLLAGLGPEPLEPGFTPAVLAAALRGRAHAAQGGAARPEGGRRPGQHLRLGGAVPRPPVAAPPRVERRRGTRAARLVPAIRAVLEESIAAGGSSLRDYVRADGGIGFFQERFKVYGREGAALRGCPGPPACPGIRRIVQAGRATFHCPRLQR